MGKFTLSVFINRPQQHVFDFLSNPANLSKCSSDFESAEWTSADAPGIGSTYRVSANLLGSKKEDCSRSFNGIVRIVTAIG